MPSNLFDIEIHISIDLVHHLDTQPIFKKIYAQFMKYVVKICPKGNDVFSHSVTLFKCGGTGSTGTSQDIRHQSEKQKIKVLILSNYP